MMRMRERAGINEIRARDGVIHTVERGARVGVDERVD